MVWCCNDRWNVFGIIRFVLLFKKIVAYRPRNDPFPMFFEDDVARIVNDEQTVDHDCDSYEGRSLRGFELVI